MIVPVAVPGTAPLNEAPALTRRPRAAASCARTDRCSTYVAPGSALADLEADRDAERVGLVVDRDQLIGRRHAALADLGPGDVVVVRVLQVGLEAGDRRARGREVPARPRHVVLRGIGERCRGQRGHGVERGERAGGRRPACRRREHRQTPRRPPRRVRPSLSSSAGHQSACAATQASVSIVQTLASSSSRFRGASVVTLRMDSHSRCATGGRIRAGARPDHRPWLCARLRIDDSLPQHCMGDNMVLFALFQEDDDR